MVLTVQDMADAATVLVVAGAYAGIRSQLTAVKVQLGTLVENGRDVLRRLERVETLHMREGE